MFHATTTNLTKTGAARLSTEVPMQSWPIVSCFLLTPAQVAAIEAIVAVVANQEETATAAAVAAIPEDVVIFSLGRHLHDYSCRSPPIATKQ
jgi:hypothetical protein